MIEPGDIVRAESTLKYVVADFAGGPAGRRLTRLLRFKSDGNPVLFTKDEAGLTLVERPTFEVGQAVRCGGRDGVVASPQDNGVISIAIAATAKPLASDPRYAIEVPAAIVGMPLPLLVLENCKL